MSAMTVKSTAKNMTTTITKQAALNALRAFIAQRSGIDYRNYGERESFMGDYKPILREGRDARAMLRSVELRDSITAQNLIDATRAFSGRLKFEARGDGVAVEYTTGQYFPTEYRAAACAVLSKCLWEYWHGCATKQPGIVDVGGYIRKQARNELGRGITARWFN